MKRAGKPAPDLRWERIEDHEHQKKDMTLTELLDNAKNKGEMIPLARIAKLYHAIDKKHPYEIRDDFQDGYDLALAEVKELVRDVLRGE